jgi:hypothetical protein
MVPYEKIVYKDVQVPVEVPVEKVCTFHMSLSAQVRVDLPRTAVCMPIHTF